MGQDRITARNAELTGLGMAAWADAPQLQVLGNLTAPRLPIFSLRVRGPNGFLHQADVTRALSDLYGIQARGGCACADPYAHRLLAVSEAQSARMRQAILAGDDSVKPGFVRLNLSVLMSEAEVDFILDAVSALARTGLAA